MNKTSFKKRTFAKTLELLCEAKPDKFFRAGKINRTAVADEVGTSQANVSRYFTGQFEPTSGMVEKFAKTFNVTPAQMRGEEPIDWLDGIQPQDAEDVRFIQNYSSLPDWMKKSLQNLVDQYHDHKEQN